MDILFQVLLFAHILGAICGLGATFATPFIMKGGEHGYYRKNSSCR
ncbi:hypothetical protein ACP8HI_14685 [Paenibacillus sp. FA6]